MFSWSKIKELTDTDGQWRLSELLSRAGRQWADHEKRAQLLKSEWFIIIIATFLKSVIPCLYKTKEKQKHHIHNQTFLLVKVGNYINLEKQFSFPTFTKFTFQNNFMLNLWRWEGNENSFWDLATFKLARRLPFPKRHSKIKTWFECS